MKKLIWKLSSINILYKFLKKELIKITNLHEKFIVLIQLMIIFFDEIIQQIKEVNGEFAPVFHNYTFSDDEKWKGFKELFNIILDSANEA